MDLHYHDDLQPASPFPGVSRLISMDQPLGSASITMGIVTIEPGQAVLPHTHRVEESMTLLQGDVRILVGEETYEARGGRRLTFLVPGNTVHAVRNIGDTEVVLSIAYPSVGVTAHRVEMDF